MAKKEELIAEAFQEFLETLYSDVELLPIREGDERRPDLLVRTSTEVMIVEIKSIQDRQHVEHSARWASAVNRLRQSLDNHSKRAQLRGSFLVDTPKNFRLPTNNDPTDSIADKILTVLLTIDDTDEHNVTIEGLDFGLKKFSDDNDVEEGLISFADASRGGTFNAAKTVHTNVASSILKASEQLRFMPPGHNPTKKILLLSNEYVFGNPRTVIEGLAYSFEDLRIVDIDEIWLQTESYSSSEIRHDLVLTKEFIHAFFKGDIGDSSQNIQLLEEWYIPLTLQSDEYKSLLFSIMQQLFTVHKPHDIISNENYVRDEMVRLGEWLTEKGRFDDAVWLVEKFIDDPDPNANSSDIEDPNSIRTVLGHLAWVIQQLTTRKDYIVKAFEFSKVLSQHSNPYIKLQSLIPLIEITKRRKWLEEIDDATGSDYKLQLKNLNFSLLRNYGNISPIGNWLAHLFSMMRDLTTDEAKEVLTRLKNSEDAPALYVYFAIFRQYHYKNADGSDKVPFDSTQIENFLEDAINSFDKNPELTNGIAWQLTKIIRDSPEQFEKVKPWVEKLLNIPHQKYVEKDLEMILPLVFDLDSKVAVEWLKKLVTAAHKHIVTDNNVAPGHYWFNLDQLVRLVAIHSPNDFIDIFEKVLDIWKSEAFVGDPQKLFTAYSEISDPAIKEAMKQKSVDTYRAQMKQWSNLRDIDWPA